MKDDRLMSNWTDTQTIRRFDSDVARSWAVYSPCDHYRYSLARVWDPTKPKLTYVMLNPSKATEIRNDPTIERCERRARALGYGAFCVTNLFAWRATKPDDLRRADDPEGPSNADAIKDAAAWADTVVAAWGVHGTFRDQATPTRHLLRASKTPVFHLGLTKAGQPRHPLYVAYAQSPSPWHEL